MIEHTSEYAHAHPMSGGRRFEHVHPIRPAVAAEHAALRLGSAHPELADVERAPEPGSPEDLRNQAHLLRVEAADFRRRAGALDEQAERLERQAAANEQAPPDTGERFRRLLDGGLH
jgi:hypothetical protein